MKRNQGFTLIELIIVIVILGILAVTAAPKFLNFSKDARESTLKGVKGSLEAAASLAHGKALLESTADEANLNAPYAAVKIKNAYPAAESATIAAIASLDSSEWRIVDSTSTAATGETLPAAGIVAVVPANGIYTATAADACQVTYTQAAANAQPVITVYADGCK